MDDNLNWNEHLATLIKGDDDFSHRRLFDQNSDKNDNHCKWVNRLTVRPN